MGELGELLNKQKDFFRSGKSKDINFRINMLKKLKLLLKDNEDDILNALKKDLGKSYFEGYTTEMGLVYEEINLHIKKLKKWSKRTRKKGDLIYYPVKNYIYNEPYGVVLIIGPFNYPFQLIIAPLIGAISAGNCSILKPSEAANNTANILYRIINDNFKEEYLRVVAPNDGKEVVSKLINMRFDYIFFTGSIKVGKIVMEAAAKNLIPVTLELGGKSPCIVDKDSNLEIAAKRIVWGKLLNAGQTCVAPDYLLLNEEIEEKFLKLLVKEIKLQYGEETKNSEDYPRIIREVDVERLKNYFKDGEIYFGGEYDIGEKYVMPTIIRNVNLESPLMKEEIFGPILPVVTFKELDGAIDFINNREKPLALYYFSENKNKIEKILNNTSAGGVTINDTVIHVAINRLPFGGVGSSGMGSYHGKQSYLTFTHKKSVVKRGTYIEFPIRFAPFKNKLKIVRKIMK